MNLKISYKKKVYFLGKYFQVLKTFISFLHKHKTEVEGIYINTKDKKEG